MCRIKTVHGNFRQIKKYLGVLTPLITAEKKNVILSFDGPFSLHMRCPLFLSGASGSFCIFLIIIFNLIHLFIYFYIPCTQKKNAANGIWTSAGMTH